MMRSRLQFPLQTLRRYGRQCLAFSFGLLLTWIVAQGTVQVAAQTQSPVTDSDTPIAQAAPDPTDALTQGRRYYQQGRYAQAQQAWEQAVTEFARNGDRARQALGLSYLAMVHQDLGDWSAAEKAIAQSLALLSQNSGQFPTIVLAQVLNTQASLQFNQSQFQPAYQTWQQAQAHYTAAGDQLGAWGTQINQAQALKELGFYRRATQMLLALNTDLAELPDSELKLSGLQTLGSALQAVGNTPMSYQALEQGLTIAQELGATRQISRLHTQIGRLVAQLGDLDRALAYFQTAARVADQAIDQLPANLELLKIYRLQSRWSAAGAIAPQLYEQLATLPPSRTQLYGVINLAHQVQQLPPDTLGLSFTQLDILLRDAATTAAQFQDHRAIAHILRERGNLYALAEQPSQAIELMEQSVTLARALPAEDVLSQSAWRLGQLLGASGERDGAIAAYIEAVQALQSLRGDLVAINQDLQFSFREGVEPVYRELVSLLLATPQPSQTELEQARNTIEGLQLAELDNYFQEACADLEAQNIDQADPAATVFYPIILPDKLAVILAQAGQPLRYYQTAIPQAQLEQQLDQLLMDLHPAADYEKRLANAGQLYDWLIRPAQAQQALHNTKTLVFVLDGMLRNIPMSVLYDGEHYLIEQYAIAFSPGLQLLQGQPLSDRNLDAVVGGISAARGQFRALPEVEREVERIAQQTDSTTLINAEFTSAAVSQAVQTRPIDVVHLATHGQFSSNPEETFFLTWNGRINVRELADILQNRQQAEGKPIELLVLSACDTATGDDRATLGLAGLAVKSGVRSTVATLWPIKDQVAAQLMIDFYEQLLTPGVTRAEALRQAQLRLLAQPDYQDPFFWSPYILVGNWR
ncbi:MAG: CHAT domain-containing protein [Spirulina sp. SIO3F2]|nr:CHAT domain-containing protein [Spirulina sp. SIO3F2]